MNNKQQDEWRKVHDDGQAVEYRWLVVANDQLGLPPVLMYGDFIKAHCFHEADADQIVADHSAALLLSAAREALEAWDEHFARVYPINIKGKTRVVLDQTRTVLQQIEEVQG